MLTITHNGAVYINCTPEELAAAGVPAAIIGAAIKDDAASKVTAFADQYRAQLASASAGKLAEYRIKEEIARDPAAAVAAELAMIDREAAARGIDRTVLLAEISAKAQAYRQIALLVGALEVEAKAAIAGVSDDAADIETYVAGVLVSAQAQAQTAFADAQALLAG